MGTKACRDERYPVKKRHNIKFFNLKVNAKKKACSAGNFINKSTRDKNRTCTAIRPLHPECSASTNFATRAGFYAAKVQKSFKPEIFFLKFLVFFLE